MTLARNAADYGIMHFGLSSAQQGIVHVIGPELGFTQPGLTIVCGDSHTSTHGAFGALAFGIGTSEVEHVLATQTLNTTWSKTFKIQIDGQLRDSITSKDLILHIIGLIGTAGGTGTAIEFAGSAIENLSMESRMSLCNMAIEAGAKTGLVAPDQTTIDYLRGRPGLPAAESMQWQQAVDYWLSLASDDDAVFHKSIKVDAGDVPPMVTWGTSPEQVLPVASRVPHPSDFTDLNKREACVRALDYMGLNPGTRLQDVPVDVVFIGSCTNSRLEDLRAAAAILQGRMVAANVKRAIVVPGSGMVKRAAEAEGLDEIFKQAGFEWRDAGCSMCCGLNEDALGAFERCASTSNRNFENRQGTQGRTHLMSPSMAAAAAITGRLTDVRLFSPQTIQTMRLQRRPVELRLLEDGKEENCEEMPVASTGLEKHKHGTSVATLHPFCEVNGVAAPLLLTNIDTDTILPVQFCKTIERSGLGLFHKLRYAPDGSQNDGFVLNQDVYRNAKILIVGPNFGCGSSREHAVWALQGFGFRCLIAPSYADIFYNNAFKNGLLPVRVTCSDMMNRITAEAHAARSIRVDLILQKIFDQEGHEIGSFEVEEYRKERLLNGTDEIDSTLALEKDIAEFEKQRKSKRPWIVQSAQFLSRFDRRTAVGRNMAKQVQGELQW